MVERLIPDFLWIDTEYTARKSLDGLEHNKMRVVPGLTSKAMSVASGYAPRAIVAPIVGTFTRKSAAEIPAASACRRRTCADDLGATVAADRRKLLKAEALQVPPGPCRDFFDGVGRGSPGRTHSDGLREPVPRNRLTGPGRSRGAVQAQLAREPFIGRVAVDGLAVFGLQWAGRGCRL